MAGKFIAIEGIPGSGKTIQCSMLVKRLLKKSSVLHIMDDHSSLYDSVRHILLSKRVSPISELLFSYALREAQLIERVLPGLEDKDYVVADTFNLNPFVRYCCQQFVPIDKVKAVNDVVMDVVPDLLIVLKVDPEDAARRIGIRNIHSNDNITKVDADQLSELQYYYVTTAAEFAPTFGKKVEIVNADLDINMVHFSILDLVDSL